MKRILALLIACFLIPVPGCASAEAAAEDYAAETAAAEFPGDNLSISRYPAGHMFYLVDSALAAFRADAEAWFSP